MPCSKHTLRVHHSAETCEGERVARDVRVHCRGGVAVPAVPLVTAPAAITGTVNEQTGIKSAARAGGGRVSTNNETKCSAAGVCINHHIKSHIPVKSCTIRCRTHCRSDSGAICSRGVFPQQLGVVRVDTDNVEHVRDHSTCEETGIKYRLTQQCVSYQYQLKK